MGKISTRTQLAFDLLCRFKAEMPGRFDQRITAVRQTATALIAEDREAHAGNALWKLVKDIDRIIAPEFLLKAKQVVGQAKGLQTRGHASLNAALVDAVRALVEGDHAKCVKKCRWAISFGNDSIEQARLATLRRSCRYRFLF